MHQGLKQGDPLSEMLSRMMFKATQCGIFESICISPNNNISHLLFADDTILFIKHEHNSIQGVKVILELFKLDGDNRHRSSFSSNFSQTIVIWCRYCNGLLQNNIDRIGGLVAFST